MGYLPYRTLREATKTVHTSCNTVPYTSFAGGCSIS